MIVINFKTYPQSTGDNAVKLAKICQQVAKTSGIKIVIGLQAVDIYRVASQVKIPVFSQHMVPLEAGRNTGWTIASSLKQAGASGVFLNHSERPYPPNYVELEKAIDLTRKEGLETLVFCPSLVSARTIDQFKPDYLALEEPGMVAGDLAMAKVPKFQKLIKDFSQLVKSFPLVGAGIRTKEDVIESLKLGVKGIAFASGFVKTDNPKEVLDGFASCFK